MSKEEWITQARVALSVTQCFDLRVDGEFQSDPISIVEEVNALVKAWTTIEEEKENG